MKNKRGYKDKVALVVMMDTPKFFNLYQVLGAYEEDGRVLLKLSSGNDIYIEFLKVFDTVAEAEKYFREVNNI